MTTIDIAAAQDRETRTRKVLAELRDERFRQVVKHGDQSHLPDGTGPARWVPNVLPADVDAAWLAEFFRDRTKSHSQNEGGDGTITFLDILLEEVAEAFTETDQAALRSELVQVAAVAVQWIEAIDARGR